MSTSPTEFLKIANKTAEHFGFKSTDHFRKLPECKDCTVTLPHTIASLKTPDAPVTILARDIAAYCDEKLHSLTSPVLYFNHHEVPDSGDLAVSFSIFNVPKSIAEVILIHVGRALMSDLGYNDHLIRINSLGDTESITRYGREIGNFLRRRLDSMPSEARELMKEHPLAALLHLVETGHDLAYRSPNPLEHLSDQSRKHFREIVEYLDMSDTRYEIDPKLMGHHEFYGDTLFTIDSPDTGETPISIRGGRFDELMFRSTRTRTPTTGMTVVFKDAKLPGRVPRPKEATPSVYVVQLGFGPKVRSLLLIDNLRQAGIPVFHDLTSDSLSAQLRDAEARGVRYTVIVGQKEFVDGSAIVRDMNARSQEHVPIDTIVKKLKRHVTVAA